jgi:hypothetical protein
MPPMAAKTACTDPSRHDRLFPFRAPVPFPFWSTFMHQSIVTGPAPRAPRLAYDSIFIPLFCCLNDYFYAYFLLLRQSHEVELHL